MLVAERERIDDVRKGEDQAPELTYERELTELWTQVKNKSLIFSTILGLLDSE